MLLINLHLYFRGGGGGGGDKVSTNTLALIAQSLSALSGMIYYHHWFEEFVKSKNIRVHFFQMKVHFRIYLIVWIVGWSQIELCLAIEITLILKK